MYHSIILYFGIVVEIFMYLSKQLFFGGLILVNFYLIPHKICNVVFYGNPLEGIIKICKNQKKILLSWGDVIVIV